MRRSTTEVEVGRAGRDASVLWVSQEPVTAKVLEGAPNLIGVVRLGVGLDNVDLDAATRLQIPVAFFPEYCVEEVSNHTILLLLACARRLKRAMALARAGRWPRGKAAIHRSLLSIESVDGQVLGLVGLGHIGQRVAEKASSFGMKVVAADPRYSAGHRRNGVEIVALEDLLRRADFVSVHAPLTNETRGLISYRELSLMKRSAFLINTSRGALIDEDALARALRMGRLAGAGLDVSAMEPMRPTHPLLRHPDVLVTPHIAYFSDRSTSALFDDAVRDTLRLLRGRPPLHSANPGIRPRVRLLADLEQRAAAAGGRLPRPRDAASHDAL